MKRQIAFSLLTLVILSFILASANVLAGDLKLTLKNAPSTIQYDQGSFVISFDLTNLNKDFQAEQLEFYAASNKLGTWQLPTLYYLENNSTETLEALFNLEPYQSGSFVGAITVNGTINGQFNDAVLLLKSINIVSSPSLEIVDVGILSPSKESTTFKLVNTGNEDLIGTLSVDPIDYKVDKQIVFKLNQTNFNIKAGNETLFEVSTNVPSDLELGEYTTKIKASSTKASAEADLKVSETYCKYGRLGSDLKIISIKDRNSGDDWEWKPLDEVEIEIKVENNGEDEEDITVQIDLYDPEENEIIDFEEGENEETISIEENDKDTFTFNVKVPADIMGRTHRLYVKAYLEGDEDEQCTDTENSNAYVSIKIDKESREVIADNIVIPSTVACGESVEVYATVYNIGKNDEDKAKIRVYNKELGIDQESSTFGLDEGDSKKVLFDLHIPKNATEKTYSLEFVTFYNYRKSDESYRDDSLSKKDLKIEGNCEALEKKSVSISAVLESEEAKAGKDLVIRATLTNTGDVDTTYTLTASGNEAWSSLRAIEPSTLSLKPAESKNALITLAVNKDASGENSFMLKALYNGKITEQPVSVFIEKSGILTGLAIGEAIGGNWIIWLIAAINIILIVLIIIVAVRASRR